MRQARVRVLVGVLISLVIFLSVRGGSEEKLSVEKSFSTLGDGNGFSTIPLQSETQKYQVSQRLPLHCCKSFVTSTGSFAKARDFYAISCTGLKTRKAPKSYPDGFGITRFFDNNGEKVGEAPLFGYVQGIGDKILLCTLKGEHYLFSKKGKYEAKRVRFKKDRQFSTFLTCDDALVFVFEENSVITESINVDDDGFAILEGRRIRKEITNRDITKHGYSYVKEGKLLAYRWGTDPEDVPVKILESSEPLNALVEENNQHNKGNISTDTYVRAYVTANSIIAIYSLCYKTIIAIQNGDKWSTQSFANAPSLIKTLNAEILLNSETSEVLLPFKRDLFVLSKDLKSVKCYPSIARNAHLPQSIEIDEGKFLFLTQNSVICKLNSQEFSLSKTSFPLAFPNTKMFKNGFIQTASDISSTKISILRYPDFKLKTLRIEGNVYVLSNVLDGMILLCSKRQDAGTYLLMLDTNLRTIVDERKLPTDRIVSQIHLSVDNYAVSYCVEHGDRSQTILLLNRKDASVPVIFEFGMSEIGIDVYRVVVLDTFKNCIIVEKVESGIIPGGIYLLEKDKPVFCLAIQREKWSEKPIGRTFFDNFLQRWTYREGASSISLNSIFDDPIPLPLFRAGSRMDVSEHAILYSLCFSLHERNRQGCFLIDEDGKRHLWELDRYVGYVYAPSTNPDKLYSPSIVPGKIIEFSRDK